MQNGFLQGSLHEVRIQRRTGLAKEEQRRVSRYEGVGGSSQEEGCLRFFLVPLTVAVAAADPRDTIPTIVAPHQTQEIPSL